MDFFMTAHIEDQQTDYIDITKPGLRAWAGYYVEFDNFPYLPGTHVCIYDQNTGKLKSIVLDDDRYETIKREAA